MSVLPTSDEQFTTSALSPLFPISGGVAKYNHAKLERPSERIAVDILRDLVIWAAAGALVSFAFTSIGPIGGALIGGIATVLFDITEIACKQFGMQKNHAEAVALITTIALIKFVAAATFLFLGLPPLGLGYPGLVLFFWAHFVGACGISLIASLILKNAFDTALVYQPPKTQV